MTTRDFNECYFKNTPSLLRSNLEPVKITIRSHNKEKTMNNFKNKLFSIFLSIIAFTQTTEIFAEKAVHMLDQNKLLEIKKCVEKNQVKYNIPGVAIAIVQDGEIICSQGFGIKEVGKTAAVTPDTLFMIGSISKSLTTFMMAKCVDEGLFAWDTPVTQVMPTFTVGSKSLTSKLQMQDMVAMHSGMPREESGNYKKFTPETFMKAMAKVKPINKYHEIFHYSNDMVAAGGYIAGQAVYKNYSLGQAYDTAMQQYVFNEIGMPSTTLNFDKAIRGNHAKPHELHRNNKYKILSVDDERYLLSVRPAGGIWSNVNDMAQYLITELNNGVNSTGNQIISQENLLQRRHPYIKVNNDANYGLGFFVTHCNKIPTITHGGNTQGFTANMCFFPDQNIGVVILTNAGFADNFLDFLWKDLDTIIFNEKN